MFPVLWSKTEEKKRRRVTEEDTNREGHWYRDFSVRSESWPMIEHWAKEQGYRLVAMKGRRRLYRKGDEPSGFCTFLDVRHDEARIVLSGWIQAGFRARALRLFMIPQEILIQPIGGLKAISVRRSACRDFNSLLSRFRQPEILGSNSFHISDIDHSTLLLLGLLLLPLHVFLIVHVLKLEVKVGLSNILLTNIAVKLQFLLATAIGFAALHHFGIVKWVKWRWAKATSVAAFTLVFSILTVFFGTRTSTETLYSKMTYHCFVSADETKCASALEALPLKEREALAQKSEFFRKQIAIRNK